jgi:hypothetical protein
LKGVGLVFMKRLWSLFAFLQLNLVLKRFHPPAVRSRKQTQSL